MSADIDPETLSYEDRTVEHMPQPPVSRQFLNRLYDRDTQLLSHYDVNFLFVLSLYARNNAGAKEAYRSSVRDKFRESIRTILNGHFTFYAMEAHPDVDSEKYLREHFKEVVGKVFNPYRDKNIYSLALDMKESESRPLIDRLREDFYVAECKLGDEPAGKIREERERLGVVVGKPVPEGCFLTCTVRKDEIDEDSSRLYELFANHQAEGRTYVMVKMPGGPINEARYLLPLVDKAVDGYYDIVKTGFGKRTKVIDGLKIPGFPTLRISIGKYHPFDRTYTKGVVPNMTNQIWTPQQLKEYIFDKADTYSPEEDTPVAEEPGVPYASESPEDMDYIE